MAKKNVKPAAKGKNKVENKTEPTPPPPKKDPPPPDNTNIAAVEPLPPQSPPPAPVPPPAAEIPIPIPPPRDPPASAKFETSKSPSVNSNWITSPPKAALQEVPDDNERSDQAWGKSGQTDDMYWPEDQAHATNYQHGGEDEWDEHDDEHYDDNYDRHYDKDYDEAEYADMNQPSGTHPHNSPTVGSRQGWDQSTSNWEHPDTTPPPGPGTPVQGHRGGGSSAGGNTPNGHPSALPPAGPGSESGGGYRSPWRIDGKPPDKVQTASAAARKTVAFAGVKPTPPSSNQGHRPSQPAPLQLPKISQASKQAGLPHGGGEDWGFGVSPGAAWGGPEPAQTWDHAPSAPVTSHGAPPASRANPGNTPFTGGWTQWVKEAKGVASVTKITANVPTAHPPAPAPPQQGARTSSVPSGGGRSPSAHHQHPHSLAAMLAHAQRGLAQAHLHQARSPTFPMPNIPGAYGGYPQYMQPGGHQRSHSVAAPPPPPAPPPPGAHQQHPHGGAPWVNLVHGPGHGPGPYGGQDSMAAQQKPSKKSKGGDPKSPPMQQQDSWGTWTGTDNWDSPMGGGAGWGPAGGASAGGWGGSTSGGGGGHDDGWKDPGGGHNDGWGGATGDWTDPGAGGGWDDKGSKGGWDDKGSKGGWGDSGSKGGRRDSGSKGGWGGPSGAGDWGGGGGGAGGAGAWDTIAEEDEEEEGDSYDDGWDDEEEDDDDDGWGTHQSTHQSSQGHQKRTSQSHAQPAQGYYQSPQGQPSQTGKYGVPKSAQSHTSSQRRKDQQQKPLPYDPSASYTMNMVYGRTTSVAELAPPPQEAGQLIFVESHGDSLRHAHIAMYSTVRPAAERIRWGFRPENDPRVMSVLDWIKAYSDGIAALGLRRFLKSGKRGILITNAEYRVNDDKVVNQPAFDWVTIKDLQPTWDKTLQESVICYNPRVQVVVIVFLLSRSGKSMAVWRRKLPLPEGLRRASQKNIEAIMAKLDAVPRDKAYVDVLPPAKPEVKARAAEPPPPPKKKSWWKRLFGV